MIWLTLEVSTTSLNSEEGTSCSSFIHFCPPSSDTPSEADTILTHDASPLVLVGASNVRDTYQSPLVGQQCSCPDSSILSPVSQYQRKIGRNTYAPSTLQYLSKPSVGFETSPPYSARKKIRGTGSILPTTPPSSLENPQGYQSQLPSIGANRSINSISHAEQGPIQDRYTQATRVDSPSTVSSARKWITGSVHPLRQSSSGGNCFFNSIENTPTLPPVHHAKLSPESSRPVPGIQKGMIGFKTSRAKGLIPTISSVEKHEAYGNQTVSALPQLVFHDYEPLFVAPIQPMLRNYADNSSSLLPGLSQTRGESSFAVVIPVPSRSITQHAPVTTGPCWKNGPAVLQQRHKGSGSTGSCRRSSRLNPEKSDLDFQTLAAKNAPAVDSVIASGHIPVAEKHKTSLLSPSTLTTTLKCPRSDIKSLKFRQQTVGAPNRTDITSPRRRFENTTHCSECESDPQKRKHPFEVVIRSRTQSGAKVQERCSALNIPSQSHHKTPPDRFRGLTYDQIRPRPKEPGPVHFTQTAEDKKIAVPAVPSASHQEPQAVGGSGFRLQLNMPSSSQESHNRSVASARASSKNRGSTTPWIPRQRRMENSPFRGLKITTAATSPMGPLGRLPMGNTRLPITLNHRQATPNSYLRTPTMSRPRGAASLRARRSGRSALPNTPRPIIVPLAWSARSYAAAASAASPEVSPSIRKQRDAEGVQDRALVDLAQNYQENPSFNGDARSSKN